MKRLALGAAIGTAVGVVLDRLHVTRRRPGTAAAGPDAAWSPNPPPPTGSQGGAPAADVAPEELTSPGTVTDPALEEQRAREAAERERESRLSEETKYDELREQEAQSDASQIVGDVPEPRDE